MSRINIAPFAMVIALVILIAPLNAQATNATANSVQIGIVISPSATNIIQDQNVTFTNTVTGGTPPYLFEYIVSPMGGVLVGANAVTFNDAGTFNVVEEVTDSAGFSAYSKNSVIDVGVVMAVNVSPNSAYIDTGQSLTLNSSISGYSGNVTYQWYNATNGTDVAIHGANSPQYVLAGMSAASNLTYYLVATEGPAGTVSARSNNAVVTVYPALNVTTDYYPPIISITTPHSYTVNALYYVQVSGGTGNYVYSWNTSQLYANAFIIGGSCHISSQFCNITAANVSKSVSGLLSLSVYDTSSGNASYASPQYFFVTADPDPPLASDYLGRNVSQLMSMPLRIGVITPAVGQIVYGLGLGSDVVAVTAVVNKTMPSFGIGVSRSATNIGLNYDYYLPDYFEELVNASANYVPVDAGAFEGTLSAGLTDFQAADINAIVLGGGFDKNISAVEKDIMLVANSTNTTANGTRIVSGMNRIMNMVSGDVSGTARPTVAMINWYGYGSMYVDGSDSFIGSEMSNANAQNIFSGYYPSPSAGQLISSNPDYIIASIFGTPYDNISTTYQSLESIPGIKDTAAWKDGHVYVLGNLATNITDEPGQLAVYGTLLYAIILHPVQFGFNQTTLPNNITGAWVEQNIRPSVYLQSWPGTPSTSLTTTTQPCSGFCVQGSSGSAVHSTSSLATTVATINTTTSVSITTTSTTTVQEKSVMPLSKPNSTVAAASTVSTSVVSTVTPAPSGSATVSASQDPLLAYVDYIIRLVEGLLRGL